jgi:hypothetical protein
MPTSRARLRAKTGVTSRWPTAGELEDLVGRFLARTVPKEEWTHQAHIAVGTWHVHRYGVDGALVRLREGIRGLNDVHGTVNSDTGGYHETITRAYLVLIERGLAALPASNFLDASVRALLNSSLAAKDALMAYYTRGVLMSVAARRGWVEPDRSPL